jgi:hypothetical protein
MLNVEMLSFIMLSVIMLCITPQFLSLMLQKNKFSLISAGLISTLCHDKQLNDDQCNNSVSNNTKMWHTLPL